MVKKKKPITEDTITTATAPPQDAVKTYILDCIRVGASYRDKFKENWQTIEDQIQLRPPANWSNKKAWQSRVYLPLQAGGSEGAMTQLKTLLFGAKFFDIVGVDKQDKEWAGNLVDLMHLLLRNGNFEIENDFCLQEAVDIGSSFLKIIVKPDKSGVICVWRSVLNCLFDPSCGNDFEKCKWWIDEYKRDIGWLNMELDNPESIYDKEVLREIIRDYSSATETKGEAEVQRMTQKAPETPPAEEKIITVHEFWGLIKSPRAGVDKSQWSTTADYVLEWRVITIVNEKYIIRNEANTYGFIPAVMMKTKQQKYDTYGRGFLDCAKGIQNLANSLVNLGMDSAKMSSFDITIVDDTKVVDWSSIKYEPLAVWRMRGKDGVDIKRQSVSGLGDMLRGLAYLDNIYQDAVVTRHAQGTTPLTGQSGAETLGEYKMKLEAVNKRFLVQGLTIENCYLKPLARKLYSILVNPDLFDQKIANLILGYNERVEMREDIDPMTGEPTQSQQVVREPKLNMKQLNKEFGIDVRFIGLMQTQEVLALRENIASIMEFIGAVPEAGKYLNIGGMLKRLVQAIRFPDSEEVIRSDEEVAQIEAQQQQQAMQQQLMLQQQKQAIAGGGGGQQTQIPQ